MADEELLGKLKKELQDVRKEPQKLLDSKLFEECGTFLPPTLEPSAVLGLVRELSSFLLTLQQDPEPVTRLLQKLARPLSFSDVISLDVPFEAGLDLSASAFHELIFGLLEKATATRADAAVLANMPRIFYLLMRLWLLTPDPGIADRAACIVLGLLRIDQEITIQGISEPQKSYSGGLGLVWRRMFTDEDVYSLFYSCTSLRPGGDPGVSKKDRSIAQARVMDMLSQIGKLDWKCIAISSLPDIERKFVPEASVNGLLDYACNHMVDAKNDLLMHINLLKCYIELLKCCDETTSATSSPAVEYLESRQLHSETMSYWLKPESHDAVDVSFLYRPAAEYIATYASLYPEHLLRSPVLRQILTRLVKTLGFSAAQWVHGQSPKHDLGILSSLPRIALLSSSYLGVGRSSSPLLLVPSKISNADALNTLATILHGPRRSKASSNNGVDSNTMDIDSDDTSIDLDAAAAKACYISYQQYHETLFSDLINAANTVALPENAMAALNVLSSIASARWGPLPSKNAFDETQPPTSMQNLPSKEKLVSLLRLPPNSAEASQSRRGMAALFTPPAFPSVWTFFLSPPQRFSNLVGGRGDTESAAYRIAMAKWDAFLVFRRELKEFIKEGIDVKDHVPTLEQQIETRFAQGPWGSGPEIGGRIATLEL